MKPFRKPNSRFYWYDFTVRGHRYRRSTQETKLARAAKAASVKLGSVIEGTDPFPSKPSVLSDFAERFDTFEALMNTHDQEVRKQFRERVRQLADEFKIKLSGNELNDAYTLRSKLVHAQSFLFDLETILPKSQHSALYEKLESLLRQTLLRCLLDGKFGDSFRDETSVENRWPVGFAPRRKRTGRSRP